MTPTQKLELRHAELTEAYNAIASQTTYTDDDVAKMNELGEKRSMTFAALTSAREADAAAQPVEDGEPREKRGLESQIQLRTYYTHLAYETEVDGAEAEYSAAEGVPAGIIPWAAIAPLQTRADATSAAPSDHGSTMSSALGRVFADSVLPACNVAMHTASSGDYRIPVINAGASPARLAKGGVEDADAITWTVATMTPTRATTRVLFGIEDIAEYGGLEEALRTELRGALVNQIEAQVMGGNGTAPNVAGFLGGGLTAPSGTPTDNFDWNDVILDAAEAVDGIYAKTMADVTAIIGVEHHSTMYSKTQGHRIIGFDFLTSGEGLPFRHIVNPHVPAKASNIQHGLYVKGSMPGAALTTWNGGLNAVRDPYTAAAKGQVALTISSLYDFAITRSAMYLRKKYDLA